MIVFLYFTLSLAFWLSYFIIKKYISSVKDDIKADSDSEVDSNE